MHSTIYFAFFLLPLSLPPVFFFSFVVVVSLLLVLKLFFSSCGPMKYSNFVALCLPFTQFLCSIKMGFKCIHKNINITHTHTQTMHTNGTHTGRIGRMGWKKKWKLNGEAERRVTRQIVRKSHRSTINFSQLDAIGVRIVHYTREFI